MHRMLPFLAAVFLFLEAVGAAGFFLRAVVAVAAHAAFQPDVFAHGKSPKAAAVRNGRRRGTFSMTNFGVPSDFRSSPNSSYSITLVTTPEPTVLPPSRMAKRRPSSM